MEEEIKFYKTDSKGFLLNQSDLNLLPKEYTSLLDEVTNIMVKNYSDDFLSLFLGGSIIRKNLKDKDIILLVVTNKPIDLIWLEDFKTYLENKYSCKISILFKTYKNIKEDEEYKFHLKTKWVFISGKNLLLEINDYKVDEKILFYNKKYKQLIKSVVFFISNNNLSSENIKDFCKSYMAHFILMGFELCMLKERKYSDDIYTCYKVFSKYYPQYKKYIDEIYSYYKDPIDDKNKLIEVINKFPQWILLNFKIINSEKELENIKKDLCLKP